MTIVFKVSDNIKKQMIDYYKDKRRDKTPPYAIFQADEADTNITLYESGKVMFQGMSADIDANMWKDLEKHLNNRDIDAETADKETKRKMKKKILDLLVYQQWVLMKLVLVITLVQLL